MSTKTDTRDVRGEDIFDSRDVIARMEFLRGELADMTPEEFVDEYDSELADLTDFIAEASGAEDWEYGAQFIRDSYFETYARELADDIGAIDSGATWPNMFIDWGQATGALKMDYTEYDAFGHTYWAR